MTDEDFFVRFHNIRGNQIMEISAEKPNLLITKMIENSEAISSLTYDNYTTNLRNKFKRAGENE